VVYTDIAILAFFISIVADIFLFKAKLVLRKAFWISYAITISFQLFTNWWLTSRNIVMYHSDAIMGVRVASAPIEDLFFGFALVLLVINMWIYWGKKGVQKD
jgi:lycopene cyclase domain-containing protein